MVLQAKLQRQHAPKVFALQHTATHCKVLQHVLQAELERQNRPSFHTLQYTATYYNALQQIATHCNMLQHAQLLALHTIWKCTSYS